LEFESLLQTHVSEGDKEPVKDYSESDVLKVLYGNSGGEHEPFLWVQ
jgi:hypothetical protein